MARFYKKAHTAASCHDLAVERLRLCFDRYDKVVVSFSGGKDSTVCLNLAIAAAEEAGRLPLDVYCFDEEAIQPDTVDYIRRTSRNPKLNFKWFCLPVEHRNACSRTSPNWYPWDPEKKDLWVRPMPPEAIASWPGHHRQAIPDCPPILDGPEAGTVCHVLGIRTDESMTRYRSVAVKPGFEAFLIAPQDGQKHISKAYPVYDWRAEDVWLAPHAFGWDYNHAYDLMNAAGIPLASQRVAPPFGEQPIRGLWMYQVCWPDLWAKMTARVPGAATAARYALTELYGGQTAPQFLGEDASWMEQTYRTLSALAPAARKDVAEGIRQCLLVHASRTNDPLPDADPHPLSGLSWKEVSVIAKVGGNKLSRQSQKVMGKALEFRRARGILS